MSDEQTEQERDAEAATIGPRVNAAQLELDIDAVSRRTRKFLVEQQNTIDRLTAERDAARAEVERLRDILRRLLDAFGTPATRETETNLSEAMTAYEAANMKDEAHVLRTSIEAIRAALGIEVDHD